jgi:hypothetical protein
MDKVFLDANILFSAAYRSDSWLTNLWSLMDIVCLKLDSDHRPLVRYMVGVGVGSDWLPFRRESCQSEHVTLDPRTG